MSVTVSIRGLLELLQKLDVDILMTPEMAGATKSFEERFGRRRRKGLGARNNTVLASSEPYMAKATSTLRHPRRSGRAWQGALIAAARKMAPNVVRKAIRGIEARWS